MRWLTAATVLVTLAACGGCSGSAGDAAGRLAPSVDPTAPSPAVTPADSPTTAEALSPTPSPSPSATPAAELTSPAAEPAILADGLGIVSFGDPADAVIEALRGRYGEPTNDTGWVAELPDYGDCSGNVREMTWGAVRAGFLDGQSPYAPGGPHFINYQVGLEGAGQDAPRSPEGIGLGSTFENLEAAYPDLLRVVTQSDKGVAFRIGDEDPARPHDRIIGLTTWESGIIAMSSGYICY